MHFRRFLAMCSLILVGGILAACGSEDEEASPTATVESTTSITETQPEQTVASTETSIVNETSPVPASSAATPIDGVATPVIEATVSVAPASTPQATAVVADETIVSTQQLTGTVTLSGSAQQDYTITAEGCFGLGDWRQLKPGAQVIVRNASGTVVDVSTLQAHENGDACAWAFAIDAPADDFFSIGIPMVVEVWFDQNDPAVQSGQIEIVVP